MAYDSTPYGFVPISDKVFFPDWSRLISQDVPFSDALSGNISFDIVAKTPIYVRNGQISGVSDSAFSKMPDGTFFLPGTSIKGEVASVLRMMSLGKMGQVLDKKYGNRNLNDKSYRDKMDEVFCGWMHLTKEGAVIIDCEYPRRISLEQIDRQFGTHYDSFVKDPANFKTDVNRLAKKKYQMFPKEKGLTHFFAKDSSKGQGSKDKREFVTFVKGGDRGTPGTIVFTGQPGVRKQVFDKKTHRKKWTGKYYEFVFCEFEDEIKHSVSEAVFNAFESIHAASPDYIDFWKKKLYNGEKIPVFFILDDNDDVQSIGLSYLYKYPYEKSIHDAIPKEHLVSKMDLCDCIFGTIKDVALKGRVQFGHAKVEGKPVPMDEESFCLSQPRASFYPFYVENGKSWDEASKIAGHKRYPIRLGSPLEKPIGTDKMSVSVSMLPAGTVFREIVRFHNLRPAELGALLSAISFHGNQDRCMHSIGFGKPLGYGAVKIQGLTLGGVDVNDAPLQSVNHYLAIFEDMMTGFERRWREIPQITELMLMAQGIPAEKEVAFRYMDLKDFVEAKKANTALKRYSERIGRTGYVLPSIKTQSDE